MKEGKEGPLLVHYTGLNFGEVNREGCLRNCLLDNLFKSGLK
jgi:hypothetical protein